ncbi:hypothetical protein ABN028_19940 [Actinopolymorpha sp. B17G11]|uniref:hypothetical protein n=1 Tax=Actinopolymorpha sp. B17G11 TaxID=3160861 RepID=UPI0032E4FB35
MSDPNALDLNEIRVQLAYVAIEQIRLEGEQKKFAALRDQVNRAAVAAYKQFGSKSFAATDDDLGSLGTLTVNETHDSARVVDEDAFKAWVERKYEDAGVEYKTIVRPGFEKALISSATLDTKSGMAIDKDGEIIPGVEVKKGGDPKTPSLRYADGAKDRIRELLAARTEQPAPVDLTADDTRDASEREAAA